MLWTTSQDDLTTADAEDPTAEKSNKKRKTSAKTVPKKEFESIFEQHTDAVSSVVFDQTDGKSFYSGAFDHTVRKWDIESGNNTRTMVHNFSFL